MRSPARPPQRLLLALLVGATSLLLAPTFNGGVTSGVSLPVRVLATPNASGYGALTRGAEGSCAGTRRVLVVDTLADDESDDCDTGDCTLREALTLETGPRYVVLNTSGLITLLSNLRLTGEADSCVTFLGGTSTNGVVLANQTFDVREGFRDGIFLDLNVRPAVDLSPRTATTGCNVWDWRCVDDPFGTACIDDDDDGALGSCDGIGGEQCEAHEIVEYDAAKSSCTVCDAWNPDTQDFTGCNDAVVSTSLDSFHVKDAARDVYVGQSSLTGSLDEAFDMNLTASSQRRISVERSIIGAGYDSVDDATLVGHREENHNLTALIGAGSPSAGDMLQVSLNFNYLLHHRSRGPLIGFGNVQMHGNITFNGERDDVNINSTAGDSQLDYTSNVMRYGGDYSATHRDGGVCSEAPTTKGCITDSDCTGTCDDSAPDYLHSGSPLDAATSRLWAADNRFEGTDGTVDTRDSLGFPDDWAYVRASDERPQTFDDTTGNSASGVRRSSTLLPTPSVAPAAVDTATLADTLLPTIGATFPCRRSWDQSLVDDYSEGETGAAATVPMPPFTDDAVANTLWADTDGDGLSDAWEMAEFGHLSLGPLDDPDGDGYRNVFEWGYGSDPKSADNTVDRTAAACL